MKNKPYWQDRQEKKYLAGEKKINQYYKDLEKSFEQAKREIQSVINDFYWRYAEENQLSYAAAQIKLNQMEIGELQDFIDKVKENMGKYSQELNNMSIRARITRYEALMKQIDAQLQQLYSIEYQYKGDELLKDVYYDSYYQTWFNIDQYHGFHKEFAQISAQTVDELIRYPFDGADFSARLWKQKDHMLQKLNESITTMLIQGRNPKTLANEISKTFGTKEYEAYRLLHTEGSFIMGQGTLAGYREDRVEKYRLLATLDLKTSDICREKDGKVYRVDEAVVGVTYWPFHPNCRTTDVPVYEDDDLSEDTRVAWDPVTGKIYDVPADMTYEQWHKKYIESNPKALLEEKKWKNRHADQKQYERYQEVLGKDLGAKSLDDFQNLKYNDAEKWGALQSAYRTQNIRNKIRSDTQIKTIELGQQNKHIVGTNEYKQYVEKLAKIQQYGPSRLEISIEQAQELVDKYHGTGKIKISKVGKWNNEEVILNNDRIIGTVVNNQNGAEAKTTIFKIKYGKNGTHIVPDYPSKKEGIK
jgi:SPP1 gp7 family putative phage head morphogenesis protein